MTAPATRTSDSPILGPRDMSPSISDAGAFAPNFHSADEGIRETETDTKPVTTAPSSEPQSKEVSPSASPRIRVSFKGGSSEPESPASMARDVPPSSSAQPSDSNSNSSAHTSASEAPSLPATTINTAATGSISANNIVPLSPSRRPFSFRDVSDINEPSQIRVQSARLHHDAYDPKKSCACCERQEREPEKEKDKDKDKDKESEIKGADGNANPAKAHADTNGTTKNKTAAASPTSASASAPAPASPRAKKSSPWFGLCGICIAIRNCLAPEDMEYRCSHGRPCSHPKHRHSKGC